MELLREELIQISGGEIPIKLLYDADDNIYSVTVDDVFWLDSGNRTHAIVLFEMMKDHITEYMNYTKK